MIIPALAHDHENLLLVPLSWDHSDGMFALWSDPLVCRYSGPSVDRHGRAIPMPAETPADSDRLIEYWIDRAEQGTGFRWAVFVSQEFVGAVGFNQLGPTAEYAYHFRSSHWGRGLAGAASARALDWVFSVGTREVEAFILWDNAPSIDLITRLGFERDMEIDGRLPRYVLARLPELSPSHP